MAYTIDELSSALIKADAAGNAADAKVFADEIRRLQTAPSQAPVAKAGSAKPAAPQNWSAGDYASAAGRAAWNLPGDIGQVIGEGVQLGGQLIDVGLPWNIAKRQQIAGQVVEGGKQLGKALGGEVLLMGEKFGVPIKPKPGKEQEAAEYINAAKELNKSVSQNAWSKAATGDFGPLLTEFAEKPAHKLIEATAALSGAAGLAKNAGYETLAANLSKAASAVDPLRMPGRAGQVARAGAGKAGTAIGGKTGEALNWFAGTPTLVEGAGNLLASAVKGATKWGQIITQPEQRWFQKTYGEDLGKARQMLETAPEVSEVGVRLTPGQRTTELHRVEVPAAEEKLMRTRAATPAERAEVVRKEKLGRELNPVAGDVKAVEEAIAERDEVNRINYERNVDRKVVVSDSKLENLLARAKRAVAKAEEAAGIEGRPFSGLFDTRSAAEKAYGSGGPISATETKVPSKTVTSTIAEKEFTRDPITGQLKTTTGYDPVTGARVGTSAGEVTTSTTSRQIGGGTKPATAVPTYTGRILSQIDRALGELANLPQGAEGMIKTVGGELKKLQQELRAHLAQEDKLPELGRALEEHASRSRGIDRMKVGQFMKDLVTDINKPGNEVKFLEYWDEARKGNAGRLIKDATGDDTFTKLGLGKDGLGFAPAEIRRFERVAKDLERRREWSRQASKGSSGDLNVGEKVPELPPTLTHEGMIANFIIRLMGKTHADKATNNLAKLVFESGNKDVLAAFDKAIASGKQPDINAARVKAKALQARELGKKAGKAYVSPLGQSIKNVNLLSPDQ